MNADLEREFRADLEKSGEASVRADFYSGGGLSTGGQDRKEIIRSWLREKEAARECREQAAYRLGQLTFWVALLTLIASIIGVVATIFHF